MTDSKDQTKVRGVVDIVMLVDCSGSMQECIDAVKANIATFVGNLSTGDANSGSPIKDWRMKVCGYRDNTVGETDWFVDNPFVKDLAGVQAQLASDSLRASAGGDEPESLLDALFKLASMPRQGAQDAISPDQWRARGTVTRVIIFFTDATFHQTMKLPEAAGGGVSDVCTKIMSERIVLCGFVPEWHGYESLGQTDRAEINYVATIAESPALAHIDKLGSEGAAAQKVAVAALKGMAADAQGFQKIMQALAKSVVKSAAVEAC